MPLQRDRVFGMPQVGMGDITDGEQYGSYDPNSTTLSFPAGFPQANTPTTQFPAVSATVNATNPTMGSSTAYWENILTKSLGTASTILTSAYGGPRPGQYFQTGPQGSTAYALPQGSTQVGFTNFPGTSSSLSSSNLLLFGGLAVAALIAFKVVSK